MIAKEATGFIYCVSSLGVTGTRSKITTDIGAMTKLVKAVTDTPCAIGFGISTPEQAKEMAAHADGVIVALPLLSSAPNMAGTACLISKTMSQA